MRVFRVAVLECDTPVPPVRQKYGTYGDIFERLLRRGLETVVRDGEADDVELQVIKSNMVEFGDLPKVDQVDAILMTGSKHTSFADDAWIVRLVDYVRDVYQNSQVPIVGICFGHQILARALGGQVSRSPAGWEISVDRVELNETGRRLLKKDALMLHQMHRDAVLELPKDVENLGSSPVCEYQGLYVPGRVFALQAHPEFDEFIMKAIINARHEQKIFDDALYQDGSSRAGKQHDGPTVAAAVWRFLLGRPS